MNQIRFLKQLFKDIENTEYSVDVVNFAGALQFAIVITLKEMNAVDEKLPDILLSANRLFCMKDYLKYGYDFML